MIKQITKIDSVFEGFGNPVKLMSYYNILKEEDNVKEYKLLRNAINKKSAVEDFEEVNKCIDKIILDKSTENKRKEIKSLICKFEAILNKGNAYTVIAMSFALLIGAVSFVGNSISMNEIWGGLLIVTTLCVAFIALSVKKSEEKDSFILKALIFRLEELEAEKRNNEIVTTNNCKEYIVKVSEK